MAPEGERRCTIGLTYNQAKQLGLAHLWPSESKGPPIMPPAKSQAPDDGMNKLERDFYERARSVWGDSVYREPVKLRLAGRTWYTPDFLVVHSNNALVVYEVKGFMRDDAAVKLKVAAAMYPFLHIFLVTRRKRRWECRHVTTKGISSALHYESWLT